MPAAGSDPETTQPLPRVDPDQVTTVLPRQAVAPDSTMPLPLVGVRPARPIARPRRGTAWLGIPLVVLLLLIAAAAVTALVVRAGGLSQVMADGAPRLPRIELPGGQGNAAGGRASETAAPGTAPAAVGAATPPAPAAGWVVANTGGEGVYIRRSPRLADRIVAWPDGTPMQDLGEAASGDGVSWRKVRDPRGNVGFVPDQWLAPARRP